jgi:rubrerythrin
MPDLEAEMDIYDYAMKMEKDGEGYYRELAAKSSETGLRNIFTMLADAEVIHHNIFRRMKEHGKPEVAQTKILGDVRNIFEKMKEGTKKIEQLHITDTELYQKAKGIEKVSRDFYLKQAEEAEDPGQKEIFLKIADEEKKHFLILEEIILFVSRPHVWLENAEWYDLEPY